MKIWVDADACPGEVKELIIRAARRLRIPAVFVANKYISIPYSMYVSAIRLGTEPQAVDEHIAQYARECDIAITQDIPLASVLVPKGVSVITPRGEVFTPANVRERLSIRNFMQDVRDAGGMTQGPKPFGPRERQRFSDAFDRELPRCMKKDGQEQTEKQAP
jgi:uncharacterized protein YaiI (UPF0178 family)